MTEKRHMVVFFFQYDVVLCQAAERFSKKLLLPDTRNCLGESYFCHPPLPTKRGEKNACLGGYCFSQSHRRSKIIKIISFTWFRNAQPCPQGVFVFWYACSRKAPGNEGWGILCNHSYSAMNFLPEGLPGLQAT